MPTTTFPLAALRAQKVAALLALAHQADVPIPANMHLSDEPHESDLRFHTLDPNVYRAWSKWLNAAECRDYPGSEFRTALATVELADLGRVTVHFAMKKDA